MSELPPQFPRLTEAQDVALQSLCDRYGVDYDPNHYWPQFDLPADYVAGWVGGYEIQATKKTIYIGVSGEGEVSS